MSTIPRMYCTNDRHPHLDDIPAFFLIYEMEIERKKRHMPWYLRCPGRLLDCSTLLVRKIHTSFDTDKRRPPMVLPKFSNGVGGVGVFFQVDFMRCYKVSPLFHDTFHGSSP